MRFLFIVMQNYDLLLDKISKSAGLERLEVERRVEAKRAKLSGLISKEGAAQIIAAELNISFEDGDLKINQLMPGLKRVNVIGKIVNIFPVRTFEKNGRQGKVSNFIIADETGSTRAVLWDVNHIAFIENGDIKVGDVVELKNGAVRDSEIHLSSFSELKKSSESMGEVKVQQASVEVSLEEIRQGQTAKSRGVVVQIFQPRFYSVCPNCNKKAVVEEDKFRCAEHGIIEPKKKAILNFVIDDGSESVRVVMFSDQINSLINEADLEDEAKFNLFKKDFLGAEIYVSGRVNRNQLFNNLEIVANGIEKVDVEKLIVELEAKV